MKSSSTGIERDASWYRGQFSIAVIAASICLASVIWLFNTFGGAPDVNATHWFYFYLSLVGVMVVLTIFSGFSATKFYCSQEHNISEYRVAAQHWQDALRVPQAIEQRQGPKWNLDIMARVIILTMVIYVTHGWCERPLYDRLDLGDEQVWIAHCVLISALVSGLWLAYCKVLLRIRLFAANLAMAIIGTWIAVACPIDWITTGVTVLVWAILCIANWCAVATRPDRDVREITIRKEPTMLADSSGIHS